MQALGLIETRGLLPAIESADVMLKTAQVELVGRTFVGGGLVTIVVTGDVGAVKAAVEAGATAVEKMGRLLLISQHVIPRPHQDIDSMGLVNKESHVERGKLQQKKEDAESTRNIHEPLQNQETIAESSESVNNTKKSNNTLNMTLKQLDKEGIDALVREFGLEKSVNALQTLSVVKLRILAREYKELGIAGRAISKANKELLIQKLQEYYERGCET